MLGQFLGLLQRPWIEMRLLASILNPAQFFLDAVDGFLAALYSGEAILLILSKPNALFIVDELMCKVQVILILGRIAGFSLV